MSVEPDTAALIALARESIRQHYVCDEDGWYSCPASGRCLNDRAGTRCNCGAEEWNAKVAAVLGDALGTATPVVLVPRDVAERLGLIPRAQS